MNTPIANPPHPLRLLPARHQGPRRHAAERRDEGTPFHQMAKH
jgi:hypothetical protein